MGVFCASQAPESWVPGMASFGRYFVSEISRIQSVFAISETLYSTMRDYNLVHVKEVRARRA